MTLHRKVGVLGVGAVLALTLAGVGIAATSGGGDTERTQQQATPVSAEVVSRFAAFRDNVPVSEDVRAGQERLAKGLSVGSSESRIAHADFTRALPVPIEGSTDEAWIAPSGDYVCDFEPDPTAPGYGASCSPPHIYNSGKGIGIIAGQGMKGRAIVTVIVPDGIQAPSLIASDGTETPMKVVNNMAAAIVEGDVTLKTAGVKWPLRNYTENQLGVADGLQLK